MRERHIFTLMDGRGNWAEGICAVPVKELKGKLENWRVWKGWRLVRWERI